MAPCFLPTFCLLSNVTTEACVALCRDTAIHQGPAMSVYFLHPLVNRGIDESLLNQIPPPPPTPTMSGQAVKTWRFKFFWVKWKQITASLLALLLKSQKTPPTNVHTHTNTQTKKLQQIRLCCSVVPRRRNLFMYLYVGQEVGVWVTFGQGSNKKRDTSLDANYHQN